MREQLLRGAGLTLDGAERVKNALERLAPEEDAVAKEPGEPARAGEEQRAEHHAVEPEVRMIAHDERAALVRDVLRALQVGVEVAHGQVL